MQFTCIARYISYVFVICRTELRTSEAAGLVHYSTGWYSAKIQPISRPCAAENEYVRLKCSKELHMGAIIAVHVPWGYIIKNTTPIHAYLTPLFCANGRVLRLRQSKPHAPVHSTVGSTRSNVYSGLTILCTKWGKTFPYVLTPKLSNMWTVMMYLHKNFEIDENVCI